MPQSQSPIAKMGLSPAGSDSGLLHPGDGTLGEESATEGAGISRQCSDGREDDTFIKIKARTNQSRKVKTTRTMQLKAGSASSSDQSEDDDDDFRVWWCQRLVSVKHTPQARALMNLRKPRRRKVQGTAAETRLDGLLSKRLFGTPMQTAHGQNPETKVHHQTTVAADPTNWARCDFKPLAPDEGNCSFQPQIIEKSRKLAAGRNATWVYQEEDAEEWIPFSVHDRLYCDNPQQDSKRLAEKQAMNEERYKECTFIPAVGKQSKLIASERQIEGSKEWWDVLSHPKKKNTKFKDQPKGKKTKEQKRVEDWNDNRRVPVTYRRAQEDEPYDCTFRPQITPRAQKHVKSPEHKASFTSPRKSSAKDPTYNANLPTHEQIAESEFHPSFAVLANMYMRSRLKGCQTQPFLKPYQRPHLTGQYPYSRQHHGVIPNMKAEGDPVFTDLRGILHGMQL